MEFILAYIGCFLMGVVLGFWACMGMWRDCALQAAQYRQAKRAHEDEEQGPR